MDLVHASTQFDPKRYTHKIIHEIIILIRNWIIIGNLEYHRVERYVKGINFKIEINLAHIILIVWRKLSNRFEGER